MNKNKREKEYIIRFCHCGRIRYLPMEAYDWMSKDCKNREIIWICTNCGSAERIFLTPYDDGYAVNATDIDGCIEPTLCKIYASRGIMVPMKSGSIADTFQDRWFANTEEWCVQSENHTYKSINESEGRREDWATVDTDRLISIVKTTHPDIADDLLKSISSYAGVKIHWDGTNYTRK